MERWRIKILLENNNIAKFWTQKAIKCRAKCLVRMCKKIPVALISNITVDLSAIGVLGINASYSIYILHLHKFGAFKGAITLGALFKV